MPENIGSVIDRILKKYGISSRIEEERLFSEWPSGSQNTILKFCSPEYIRNNILHLSARDHYWRQALLGREEEVFNDLNKRFSFKHIKGIRII